MTQFKVEIWKTNERGRFTTDDCFATFEFEWNEQGELKDAARDEIKSRGQEPQDGCAGYYVIIYRLPLNKIVAHFQVNYKTARP